VTGADIDEVSNAIGHDKRIGKEFLKSSVGFGGSCFQKDILNLVYLSRYYGLHEVADFWAQVIKINNYQKNRFSKKIIEGLNGTIKSKKIGLLGWAFKKDTNDSRESASIYVADHLLEEGAEVYVYDPKVNEKQILDDLINLWESNNLPKIEIESKLKRLTVIDSYEKCFNNSSCIAILTEWDEFINYNWGALIQKMEKQHLIIDGRNILNKAEVSKVANKFIAIGK